MLIFIELLCDVDAWFGYRLFKSAQHLALLFPCQSAVHTGCQCHEFSIDPFAYSTGCFRAVLLPHSTVLQPHPWQWKRIQDIFSSLNWKVAISYTKSFNNESFLRRLWNGILYSSSRLTFWFPSSFKLVLLQVSEPDKVPRNYWWSTHLFFCFNTYWTIAVMPSELNVNDTVMHQI